MSDQCKYCTVRGNLNKCLETDCSYHELWMVKEVKRELGNHLTRIASQLEWIEDILDGQEVSDSAMRFPIVRRVWELKHTHPPQGDWKLCPRCEGKKYIRWVTRERGEQHSTICPDCEGKGWVE